MPHCLVRLVFFLLGAVFLPPLAPSAATAETVFYAVQFAELQDLRSVNRQVNALAENQETVFWEKTTAPDKGTFYRVYLGRFDTRQEAERYGLGLLEAGALTHFGIHWFTEPAPEEAVFSEPIRGRIRLLPLRTDAPAPENRFVDHENGTVSDLKTGLMWVQNGWRLDLLSALSWQAAVERVSGFQLSGHADWRLPTLEEWLSLIDGKNRNPALVAPHPFVNIISHMPYWSATEYTYSRERTCENECPVESYTVMLYSGTVNHQKKTDLAFVMPVRSLGRR